jgi:choline dehydrogenase-like flavoprotein
MEDGARFMGSMVGVCEDAPVRENRIEADARKDRFGMPLARIVYKQSDDGRRLWQTAAEQGVKIFKAAGAQTAWPGPPAGQHVMGGTILGSDRASSVLNAASQSHDVQNLFVGGPGVFPTSSSVNSTFTAHAVAMKGAQYLAANWGGLTA